jgi:hypothetical protein
VVVGSIGDLNTWHCSGAIIPTPGPHQFVWPDAANACCRLFHFPYQSGGANIMRLPGDSNEGAPLWVVIALLVIFGIAMFLSGYLVGTRSLL